MLLSTLAGRRLAFPDRAAAGEERSGWTSLSIERRGGFAGLKAKGEMDAAALDEATRAALDALFAAKKKFPAARGADRFYLHADARRPARRRRRVEIPEALLPAALAGSVKDRLP